MKSQKTNKKISLGVVIGLALVLLTTNPRTALAQQWTTNGNHISNTNSGNVGIGTTTPGAKLEVAGGALIGGPIHLKMSAPLFLLNDTSGTPDLRQFYFWNAGGRIIGNWANDAFTGISAVGVTFQNNGFMGVGTMNPLARLYVEGATGRQIGSNLWADMSGAAGGNALFGGNMYQDSNPVAFKYANTHSLIGAMGFAANYPGWNQASVITSGTTSSTTGSSFTPKVIATFDYSGNVGIGTTNPGRLLEILESNTGLQTQLRLFHANGDAGVNPGSTEIEFLHSGNQLATSKIRMVRTFNGTGSSNTDYYLDLVKGNAGNNGNTTNTVLFAQGLTGNVGIGTTNPGYKLDVQGGKVNASGGLCIAGDCKTAWAEVGGAVASVFGRTGAVAAATNDYTWAQINKTMSSLADLTTRSASDLSSGTIPDARFPATLPSASGANLTALNASSLGSGTVATARLGSGTADVSTFLRGDNTWAVPSGGSQWTTSGANINYAPAGNVGIGTGTPTYKLHVTGDGKFTGNLTVDGNISAKYQDVAEWVPASERISAGTVVVLDSTKSNQVISSTQAYDTRVAGVISEKPGIALGESGANKVLVATTGRVRIKVDATRGPIHIGDLLVTSDTSGMAMKSEPVNLGGVQIHRPGTLIGKALEPLAKGQGEILVLLSLQ